MAKIPDNLSKISHHVTLTLESLAGLVLSPHINLDLGPFTYQEFSAWNVEQSNIALDLINSIPPSFTLPWGAITNYGPVTQYRDGNIVTWAPSRLWVQHGGKNRPRYAILQKMSKKDLLDVVKTIDVFRLWLVLRNQSTMDRWHVYCRQTIERDLSSDPMGPMGLRYVAYRMGAPLDQ